MDGFHCDFEFEIINTHKSAHEEFAWIKACTLKRNKMFKAHKILFSNEMLDVKFASIEKLLEDDKTTKNAVVFIAHNLKKT